MCHWLACLWALTLELVDDKFPKWMLKACRFRNPRVGFQPLFWSSVSTRHLDQNSCISQALNQCGDPRTRGCRQVVAGDMWEPSAVVRNSRTLLKFLLVQSGSRGNHWLMTPKLPMILILGLSQGGCRYPRRLRKTMGVRHAFPMQPLPKKQPRIDDIQASDLEFGIDTRQSPYRVYVASFFFCAQTAVCMLRWWMDSVFTRPGVEDEGCRVWPILARGFTHIVVVLWAFVGWPSGISIRRKKSCKGPTAVNCHTA